MTMDMKTWILMLFMAGGAGWAHAQASQAAETEIRPSETGKHDDADDRFKQRLQEAAKGDWNRLRLHCECRGESEWRSVELFGNGVGVWHQRRQFQLPQSQVVKLMEALQAAGFAEMQEVFGGKSDPKVPEFAQRVICRVALQLDGLSKSVVQLDIGRQSKELKDLAERILAETDGPGRKGIAASDLADGLKQVAAGKLAPEVFRLVVNRKPDASAMERGEAGWLLRVEHGRVSISPYHGKEGYGAAREHALTPEEARKLADLLLEQEASDLPINLYAPHYTDLTVEVLGWDKRVQARAFAGMSRQTHGLKQMQFDAIFREIERLARESLAAGRGQ